MAASEYAFVKQADCLSLFHLLNSGNIYIQSIFQTCSGGADKNFEKIRGDLIYEYT